MNNNKIKPMSPKTMQWFGVVAIIIGIIMLSTKIIDATIIGIAIFEIVVGLLMFFAGRTVAKKNPSSQLEEEMEIQETPVGPRKIITIPVLCFATYLVLNINTITNLFQLMLSSFSIGTLLKIYEYILLLLVIIVLMFVQKTDKVGKILGILYRICAITNWVSAILFVAQRFLLSIDLITGVLPTVILSIACGYCFWLASEDIIAEKYVLSKLKSERFTLMMFIAFACNFAKLFFEMSRGNLPSDLVTTLLNLFFVIIMMFGVKFTSNALYGGEKASVPKSALVFALIVFILVAYMPDISSGSGGSGKCKVCGRTFAAGDSGGNFMNIAKTNMCNQCEKNYHYANDLLDSMKGNN